MKVTHASVPEGHPIYLKEFYENLELVPSLLKYWDCEWKVFGELQVISELLEQQ